jgi:ABC-2 type transport system permease protein
MSTQSNAVTQASIDSRAIASSAAPATRPLYWSVRRELWENRSIFVAPLAVAGVVLFGFLLSLAHLSNRIQHVLTLDPARQRAAVRMPYDFAAALILLTAFITAVFYCLEALHGERRDRSILFWKSLPVSDLTTVLSKACVPLVVFPPLVFAIVVLTQINILLLSTAALLGNGAGLAMVWAQLPLFKMSLGLLYVLVTIALWHAPIYGWLLLVSAWARKATFLSAILPLFAVMIVEKIAFNTTHFAGLLRYRLMGWLSLGLAPMVQGVAPVDPLQTLTPGRFLSAPGLWLGLLVAAGFLAAAVRLRRYRGPI